MILINFLEFDIFIDLECRNSIIIYKQRGAQKPG